MGLSVLNMSNRGLWSHELKLKMDCMTVQLNLNNEYISLRLSNCQERVLVNFKLKRSLSDMYSLFKLCLHANFISENQVRSLSVNKILLLFGTVLSFTQSKPISKLLSKAKLWIFLTDWNYSIRGANVITLRNDWLIYQLLHFRYEILIFKKDIDTVHEAMKSL